MTDTAAHQQGAIEMFWLQSFPVVHLSYTLYV